MKRIKFFRNIIVAILAGLSVLQARFILPEHIACSNTYEGAQITTFWGDNVQCLGESMDVTASYFQLLSGSIVVLLFLLIFWDILYKNKIS